MGSLPHPYFICPTNGLVPTSLVESPPSSFQEPPTLVRDNFAYVGHRPWLLARSCTYRNSQRLAWSEPNGAFNSERDVFNKSWGVAWNRSDLLNRAQRRPSLRRSAHHQLPKQLIAWPPLVIWPKAVFIDDVPADELQAFGIVR